MYSGGMLRKTTGKIPGFAPTLMRLAALALLLASGLLRAGELEDAQARFLRGDYSWAAKTAQERIARGRNRYDWRILFIKASLASGEYKQAYEAADAGLSDFTLDLDLRLLFREAALFNAKPEEAVRCMAAVSQSLTRRRASFETPEELVQLGQALLLLGAEPRLILDNCFNRAEKLDPAPRDAFLAGGQLALEKHDFKLAAQKFQAGLAKFPGDADLLCGLAQAFEPSDRKRMLTNIAAALEANPNHAGSRLLLADHLIDAEEYAEAETQLDLALKVNPHLPEALAYKAVLAELRCDTNAVAALRTRALECYTTNPKVDWLIGSKLSQHYRFAEGAAAQRRALEFEPDFLPARRQLAEDLLRLGRDEEGWALAESAHKADGYDVTAYNLATLHEVMGKYQALSNANFVVHMTPREAGLYGERVLALLSRARETLCAKYGVELPQPTTVEMFAEPKDFAVRTFGMPGNPGYLGVCFGPVITANSPASQAPNPANWEDVLWHEFCHVATLTATRNRMPRWLSEGISVYEERQANPAWGEKMNLAYREMILNGGLTPISKLSGAFLSPSNSIRLQFAYYESSLAVEFIAQSYGFDKLKAILGDLREGVEINESIAKQTAPMSDLEKSFASFARAKAEQLAPGVDFEKPPETLDPAGQQDWAANRPKNYYARLRQAQQLMEEKKWSEAGPVLESLAADYHGESRAQNPLWLLAATQRHLSNTNAERAALETLAAQESDYVDLDLRLIELAAGRKDWAGATDYATRLLAINPLISAPYEALARAGVELRKPDQAIDALGKLLLLDPPDPAAIHYQLAGLLHQRGGSEADARRHILEALEEAPRFRDAQKLLLEIAANSPQPEAGVPPSNTKTTP